MLPADDATRVAARALLLETAVAEPGAATTRAGAAEVAARCLPGAEADAPGPVATRAPPSPAACERTTAATGVVLAAVITGRDSIRLMVARSLVVVAVMAIAGAAITAAAAVTLVIGRLLPVRRPAVATVCVAGERLRWYQGQ